MLNKQKQSRAFLYTKKAILQKHKIPDCMFCLATRRVALFVSNNMNKEELKSFIEAYEKDNGMRLTEEEAQKAARFVLSLLRTLN